MPDTLSPDSDAVGREDVVMARPSKYPESSRQDAVELVLSTDRPIRQIAEQLGNGGPGGMRIWQW
jgi:transposase-like protein